MTELEALQAVFERAKQFPDADPELEEALQIVDRLIKTVERAEENPHRVFLLAEDVLRQIGITIVTCIFADDVRFYLTQKGFEGLAGSSPTKRWRRRSMASSEKLTCLRILKIGQLLLAAPPHVHWRRRRGWTGRTPSLGGVPGRVEQSLWLGRVQRGTVITDEDRSYRYAYSGA